MHLSFQLSINTTRSHYSYAISKYGWNDEQWTLSDLLYLVLCFPRFLSCCNSKPSATPKLSSVGNLRNFSVSGRIRQILTVFLHFRVILGFIPGNLIKFWILLCLQIKFLGCLSCSRLLPVAQLKETTCIKYDKSLMLSDGSLQHPLLHTFSFSIVHTSNFL
jgi:hypothetical protein